jgi:uncharacterized protein YjbJ (UPF0337 family)
MSEKKSATERLKQAAGRLTGDDEPREQGAGKDPEAEGETTAQREAKSDKSGANQQLGHVRAPSR